MDGLSLQSSERLALDLDAQVDAKAVASFDLWEAGFGAEASYYGQWCGSDLRMPATSKVSKLSASVASLLIEGVSCYSLNQAVRVPDSTTKWPEGEEER